VNMGLEPEWLAKIFEKQIISQGDSKPGLFSRIAIACSPLQLPLEDLKIQESDARWESKV
jgi:hypothetical protein